MSIEEQLQKIILQKYNSIRDFTLSIDMPNSTFVSIMKRGVLKSNLSNIITICNELNLSVDALAEGRIEYKPVLGPEDIAPSISGDIPLVINYQLNGTDKKKIQEYASLLSAAHKEEK